MDAERTDYCEQCICRTDLVASAHSLITKAVAADCGKQSGNSDTDVAQAIKLYNDYCSSHGYNVPGYTYVVTTTAMRSAGATAQPTPTQNAHARSPTNVGSAVSTISGAHTVASGPIATVTVRVAASSASRLRTWWLPKMLHLALSMPLRSIHALPDVLVVTFTPSTTAPGVSTLLTAFTTQKAAGSISTQVVYASAANQQAFMTTTTGAAAKQAFAGDVEPEQVTRGKSKRDLSPGEIAGIVTGIISAFGSVATIWLCFSGPCSDRRKHKKRLSSISS